MSDGRQLNIKLKVEADQQNQSESSKVIANLRKAQAELNSSIREQSTLLQELKAVRESTGKAAAESLDKERQAAQQSADVLSQMRQEVEASSAHYKNMADQYGKFATSVGDRKPLETLGELTSATKDQVKAAELLMAAETEARQIKLDLADAYNRLSEAVHRNDFETQAEITKEIGDVQGRILKTTEDLNAAEQEFQRLVGSSNADEAIKRIDAAKTKLAASAKKLLDGITDLARGYVWLTASSNENAEAAVQMIARLEGIIKSAQGAISTLKGFGDTYKTLRDNAESFAASAKKSMEDLRAVYDKAKAAHKEGWFNDQGWRRGSKYNADDGRIAGIKAAGSHVFTGVTGFKPQEAMQMAKVAGVFAASAFTFQQAVQLFGVLTNKEKAEEVAQGYAGAVGMMGGMEWAEGDGSGYLDPYIALNRSNQALARAEQRTNAIADAERVGGQQSQLYHADYQTRLGFRREDMEIAAGQGLTGTAADLAVNDSTRQFLNEEMERIKSFQQSAHEGAPSDDEDSFWINESKGSQLKAAETLLSMTNEVIEKERERYTIAQQAAEDAISTAREQLSLTEQNLASIRTAKEEAKSEALKLAEKLVYSTPEERQSFASAVEATKAGTATEEQLKQVSGVGSLKDQYVDQLLDKGLQVDQSGLIQEQINLMKQLQEQETKISVEFKGQQELLVKLESDSEDSLKELLKEVETTIKEKSLSKRELEEKIQELQIALRVKLNS